MVYIGFERRSHFAVFILLISVVVSVSHLMNIGYTYYRQLFNITAVGYTAPLYRLFDKEFMGSPLNNAQKSKQTAYMVYKILVVGMIVLRQAGVVHNIKPQQNN